METIDKVKQFIYNLFVSLQKAQLYSTAHLIFKDSIDKTYDDLREVLRERREFTVGIISGEFAFEKEVFFDLSNIGLVKKMISCFQKQNVEKIIFYPQVIKDELSLFVSFLLNISKEQIEEDPENYLAVLGIKNIKIGKIKAQYKQSDISIKEAESAGYVGAYENYFEKSCICLEAILNNETVNFSNLKVAAMNIIENLALRHQQVLKSAMTKTQGVAALAHSVNVSILAIYFSLKAGFSEKDILDIGTSALFHDIGKICIGRKTFKKAERSGGQDFIDRTHTQLGTEILLKYIDTLGFLPAVVSFEHHLRYDSGGYPELAFPYKPHTASLIVSICDVYNSFCQRRNYKYDYSPDTIYNLMMKERGSAFDPDLLDIFFRIMGVWPIGSIVLLSDGSIAIVRQESEEDIFYPKVEVVEPQGRGGPVDLKDKKEELKIERALNPFTEGKAYIYLI